MSYFDDCQASACLGGGSYFYNWEKSLGEKQIVYLFYNEYSVCVQKSCNKFETFWNNWICNWLRIQVVYQNRWLHFLSSSGGETNELPISIMDCAAVLLWGFCNLYDAGRSTASYLNFAVSVAIRQKRVNCVQE
jgi:hypothetical protein